MLSQEEIKKKVGIYAADLIQSGMKIGMGTGSTVFYLISELGARRSQGLDVSLVPTSSVTAELAKQEGITIAELDSALQLTIDGADEIDPQGRLIKGGGGALLQEKIVAAASAELIIIADETKQVKTLGKFPLPVEVVRFGYKYLQHKLEKLCEKAVLRIRSDAPFITDHHHYIIDCYFESIDDPQALNDQLYAMPGVVETGLFLGMTSRSIIGKADGNIVDKRF